MSWRLVAKKEFQDTVRSKMVWGITLLFVLFSGGLTSYLYLASAPVEGTGGGPAVVSIFLPMVSSSSTFVPIVGLVVAYKSIVGERESGSLKLLLGLPHSRFDMMFGKLIGRSLVVAVAIIVGYLAGIVPLLVLSLSISVSEFITLLLMTGFLGVVFVGIATAFSTAMRSSRRALYGAIGIFVFFEWVWGRVPLFLMYITNGFQSPNRMNPPNWISFINTLNPQIAYRRSIAYLSPSPTGGFVIGGSQPFFLSGWFGFVILALWIIIPVTLAYYRFSTTDLG